jgi:hypothetical protein
MCSGSYRDTGDGLLGTQLLLQSSHQKQIGEIALECGSASFSICGQSQWSQELSSWFRNLHYQPRLFVARGYIETADLDAGGLALLQEQKSPIRAPSHNTFAGLQINDGSGVSAANRREQ